jgi:preprotein translocase subunit SecA
VPTESGIEKVEKQLGIENLYDEVQQNLVHQLQVALKAAVLYQRDKDYIIQEGEVKIVDEFTGRILEGRRWSETKLWQRSHCRTISECTKNSPV